MRFVPGPDLPTGGHIVGLDGVREAYQTGRGIFRTRATAKIEQLNARKTGIVVTELPYSVGPEKVIARIKDLVQAKKINGISDLKDLTDRTRGLHLVIEVRSGFNPEAILAELYRLTPMEETFGINNVALVDGQPRTLGLRELLSIYVDHRLDVTRRRTEYRRRKRQERLHLVDGIIVALLNIDEVIAVIRSSDDSAAARSRLSQIFDLSDVQAQYILDTPLRRLTRYDTLELEAEQDTLRAEIAELTEILDNDETLRALVGGEMADLAKKFGTPRRTVLMEAGEAVAAAVPLEVGDDPCLVVLSADGLLARFAADQNHSSPERTGAPPATLHPAYGPGDIVVTALATTARASIGAVTTAGRMIRFNVIEIPVTAAGGPAGALAGGHPVAEFVPGLADGETVLALAALDGGEQAGVALGTASGIVKRVQPDYPANRDEFELIALKDDDRVVGATYLAGDAALLETTDLVFITTDAQLLRFPATAVRPQGRQAGGVAGIRLADHASVLWFGAVGPAASTASTMTTAGTAPGSPDGATSGSPDGTAPGGRDDAAPRGAAPTAPVVVTVAGRSDALPGTGGASVKVTPFADYPQKGRATGGVRCQRFLKGEDGLTLAWIGPPPVLAATESGVMVDLTNMQGKRDASGTALTRQLTRLGPALP
jgi:DNA gyrase subunit A